VRDDVRDDHGRWRGVRRDEDDGPEKAEPSSGVGVFQKTARDTNAFRKRLFSSKYWYMS